MAERTRTGSNRPPGDPCWPACRRRDIHFFASAQYAVQTSGGKPVAWSIADAKHCRLGAEPRCPVTGKDREVANTSRPQTNSKITPLSAPQTLMLLLGLIFLWPGLVLGDVYAFNDTASYLRGAGKAIEAVTGIDSRSMWPGAGSTAVAGGGVDMTSDAPSSDSMILYGRSVYFGAFLYLGWMAGSFWIPVLLQALLAGTVLLALVRQIVDPKQTRAFAKVSLATFTAGACTSLPFFVCFLMPDLLVTLGVAAAVLILTGWQRERWTWRLALLAISTFAALSHSSAILLLGLLGAGGGAWALWRKSRRPAVASALIVIAAVAGFGGELLFGQVTRMKTGAEPLRPPFLTAQLIDLGPGRRYLDEHCDTAPFVLCRYPLRGSVDAQIFLWSPKRPQGGFRALPPHDRPRVAAEQLRFAATVIAAYPGETAAALGGSVVHLLGRFDLDEFRPQYRLQELAKGPFDAPPPGQSLPLPQRIVSILTAIFAILSLGAALRIACRPASGFARARAIVILVTLTVMTNDAICAVLSGSFARYNTRFVWALPIVVVAYGAAALLRAETSRVQRPAADAGSQAFR